MPKITSSIILSLSIFITMAQPEAAHALTPIRSTACTSTTISSSNLAGTWNCFRTPSSGPFTNAVYTFAQSGNRFYSTGQNTPDKVFGRIEGTALSFTEVVNGEELEGYVLYAEGQLIPVNGQSNRGIVTVYRTSQGGIGSFNCSKQ